MLVGNSMIALRNDLIPSSVEENTLVKIDADGGSNNYALHIATLIGTTGLSVQTLYDNGQIIAV